MDREDVWLAQLKKGDSAVVVSGFIHNTLRLRVVTHSTPAQVEVDKERYWRKNGRRIGDSGYHRAHLKEPTPELLVKIRRDHALSRLKYEVWDNHPNAVLFAVVTLLDEATSAGAVDPVGEKVTG